MVRKKTKPKTGFILFNVHYEDGSLSSNRKVSAAALDGLDGDKPARYIIEQQDREIAELSGRPRSDVKRIERVKK